jgi:uncharacterized protein YggU (UPF0235/DUF167 family)
MTPLDYLLILEGLILLCAGIFWGVGEAFGRGNPKDELRRMMRAFWHEFLHPTPLASTGGLVPEPEVEATVRRQKKNGGLNADGTESDVTSQLNVKVLPSPDTNQITGGDGSTLHITVTCSPESGAANKVVTDLLAEAIGLPAWRIKLVRGHYDSRKLLQVSGLDSDQLNEKLAKFF